MLVLGFLLVCLTSITFAQEEPFETPTPLETGGCVEAWMCSKWSECIDDQRTRTCTDSNACGTNNNKPAETKSCVLRETSEEIKTTEEGTALGEADSKEETTTQEESEKHSFFSSWIFKIIVVVIILFLIAGAAAFFMYKKSIKPPEQPTGTIEEQKK